MATDDDDRVGGVRITDPATSRDAALKVNVSYLEGVTVQTLQRHYPEGLTTYEIAGLNNLDRDSISPRMVPLERRGLVERTDKKRIPEGCHKAQMIWRFKRRDTFFTTDHLASIAYPTDSERATRRFQGSVGNENHHRI